ncbi:MAG: tRNA (guanine-N(7)-)-methyltransferase [Chloroflexota bacterium]|nr:tRNA (guanine-N(7)-)-methyltransferase [Chloroflexota bacterium]
MPRRVFAIRFLRPPVPDAATAAQYLRAWHGPALYEQTGVFPPVTARGLFGAAGPLHLEVGCGTGEWLIGQATTAPDAYFVGVDPSLKSLHAAVAAARARGLGNIKFLWARVQGIYPLLQPGTLRAVYLHFPDPCRRPKQRKHQLFTAAFRDQVHVALEPGGELSLMTDVPELFARMQAETAADARFVAAPSGAAHNSAGESRYGRAWAQRGVAVWSLHVCKR